MANTDFVMGQNIDLAQLYQLLGAILEKRTSDPTNTTGQIWVRTDTAKIKWYDGTTVQTLADLNSVVVSVAAADSTITVAGTSTAVTVKVAKTLDHTYITDFDAQVRTSRLDQMAAPGADVSWNNFKITNLADPVGAQDGVNLRTLQAYVNGLSDRADVYYATTAALSPANTYANGTLGVGATLTATGVGVLSVDGAAVQLGDPIMVNNEAAPANNGLYTVTTLGTGGVPYVLTRRVDFDQATETVTGALVPVKVPTGRTAGTANNNSIWISAVATPPTVGTTAISFGLIGSTYSAGTGITLTGTVFSLTAPVTIALGGTGAITATLARQSLAVPTQVFLTIGDGASTSFTFTHNLNNSKPDVVVHRISDGCKINSGERSSSANATVVTVGTTGAPIGTNTHIITVTALEGVG